MISSILPYVLPQLIFLPLAYLATAQLKRIETNQAVLVEHPPSHWEGRVHHLEPRILENCNAYFLKSWKFRNEKVKNAFPAQGLSTWHCAAFPDSKDDRVEAGAMLSVILFLVDGLSSPSDP